MSIEELLAEEKTVISKPKGLYLTAAIASLAAMAANLLDVILGFGDTEIATYGSKTAIDWFNLFQISPFKGIYILGILNIVYMTCMVPLYFALYWAHRKKNGAYAALAVIFSFIGMAIYISNNAAIPMLVLSAKYAAASTEAQRLIFTSSAEAVLARGEDFTPGSFIGLFFGGLGAVIISIVMLFGKVFGKTISWIGIIGFSFLLIFTVLATFVPAWYTLTFYLFGGVVGLLALSWFILAAVKFFRLAEGK